MNLGHSIWVFPDGDLPPREPYDLALKNAETHGHESLVILNAGTQSVSPRLHIYFSDMDPWTIKLRDIPPQRVVCHRLDEPIGAGAHSIPPGQYAVVLECDHPVVAQLGRMDVRQPNLAYYTVMGFPSDRR